MNRLVIVCGLIAVALAWRVAAAGESEALVRAADGKLQIGVDPADGTLHELIELQSGVNLLEPGGEPRDLWRIQCGSGDALRELTSAKAGRPAVEPFGGTTAGLRLVWARVDVGGGRSLKVEVRATLGVQGLSLSRWELLVAKPPDVRLVDVRFPRIGFLRRRSGETLAVPRQMGVLTRHARRLARGPDGRGGRLSFQSPDGNDLSIPCLAFYAAEGPGFYAACEDTGFSGKQLQLEGDAASRLAFEVRHEPERQAAGLAEFALPFGVVLGTFRGDWTTAAEIYRQSPASQTIAARGRLRQGSLPAWLPKTGMWMWNRGRSPEALGPAGALQTHVGAPVSVLWHWWHNCAYDVGFPEFLPPREGAEPFRRELAAAQRQGIHAVLYMNQRLWGTTTRSWSDERAERFAVKQRDGAVRGEVYNVFVKAPCAPMCVATPFWQDKYTGLARQALGKLGADGLYMDQAGVGAECYDAAHGHPPGPGRYWSAGLERLTQRVRSAAGEGRRVALAGEYCGEPWIGCLDLQLALCVSHDRIGMGGDWEPIPFYPAVYHGSTILFGSLAGLVHPPYDEKWPADTRPANALSLLDRRYSEQFYLDNARSFSWGLQPMLANFRSVLLSERREEMDFVARMARTRAVSLKYLLYGQWLRPPAMDTPKREIDVAQLGVYTPLRPSKRICPAVTAGAWRAADGNVGVALAGIDDAPLPLHLHIDPAYYGLPQRCAVYWIDHTGRRRIGDLDRGKPVWTLTLPPRGVCVIEFSPGG